MELFETLLAFALALVHPVVHLLLPALVTVLLDEVVHSQVASSYSDYDMILLNLHEDSFPSILVDSFTFSDKVHMSPHLGRRMIDVLSQFLIDHIILDRFIEDSRYSLTLL